MSEEIKTITLFDQKGLFKSNKDLIQIELASVVKNNN